MDIETRLTAHLSDWFSVVDNIPIGISEADAYQIINNFIDGPACDHEKIVVKHVLSNGTISYRYQCRKCAEILSSSIAYNRLSEEQKSSAPDRIEFDSARVYGDKHETKIQMIDTWRSRKDSQWWQRYSAYLNSPAWAEKRLKVFKRANWICEGCGEERATEVHHLTYDHVEHEFLFELVALCHGCHDRITSAQRPGTK